MFRRFGRHLPGFTLIEILITVTIIVVLASFLLFNLQIGKRLGDAENRARISNRNELRSAIAQYYAEKGHYPDGITRTPRPVCLYGNPLPDCVDLDILVNTGFIDFLPEESVEISETDTGYIVFLDKNDNIKVEAKFGRLQIKTDTPLVFIESSTTLPPPVQRSSAIEAAGVVIALPEVRLVLPVDNGQILTPVGTALVPQTISATVHDDLPTVFDSTVARQATVTVSGSGSNSCNILPPYSFIKCAMGRLQPFSTTSIAVSGDMVASSPQLGHSNPLHAQRWRLEQLFDLSPGGDDSVLSFRWLTNQLFFVGGSITEGTKLFKLSGNQATQVTNLYNGPAVDLVFDAPEGKLHIEAKNDRVAPLGILNDELYFNAVIADGGTPSLRIFKTDGQTITQLSSKDHLPGGEWAQSGFELDGNLYIPITSDATTLYADGGATGVGINFSTLFRTDGQRLTQVTERDAVSALLGTHDGWLYFWKKDGQTILSKTDGESVIELARFPTGNLIQDHHFDPATGTLFIVTARVADQFLYAINKSQDEVRLIGKGNTIAGIGQKDGLLYFMFTPAGDTWSRLARTDGASIQFFDNLTVYAAYLADDQIFASVSQNGPIYLAQIDGLDATYIEQGFGIFPQQMTSLKGITLWPKVNEDTFVSEIFQYDGQMLTKIFGANVDASWQDFTYGNTALVRMNNAAGKSKLYGLTLVE